MPTSLVTGGAGFMGSHLARELLRRGHDVVVLDDLSGGFEENVDRAATFVRGSIVDPTVVDELFDKHEFTYVFHLAAYAAEGLSHFIRRYNYTNNLLGSVNLINAAIRHDVERFVFTSSIAVYGHGEVPLREAQPPTPADPYGVAKLAVEQDLRAAQDMFGLDYVIFRPHNVYGEGQNLGDRYRNVVGIFMNLAMQGLPFTIFGDGEQTRAFSYVADVIPMIARSVDLDAAKNQVFNIGGDEVFTVNTLAKTVIEVTGADVGVRHLEARNEVAHAHCDHARAHEVFGRPDLTSLRAGVERMWSWAQRRGVTSTAAFTDIEIRKKLPPVWLEDA